ncbi:YrzI family small protein [Alteribacter populi]|nr:YrzI family small protein [Alteribacter populi]
MMFTLFHFTVTIQRRPYSEEEIEKEQHYERSCNQIAHQKTRHAEWHRFM